MDYVKFKRIETELADFFRCCHSKHYSAKSILIYPGGESDTLLYLREGSVSVCMESDDGEELILANLSQGDFLGEVGFFTDVAEQRSVTISARTECKTEEISYQKLKLLSNTELKACYPRLLQLLSEQMAKRLLLAARKAGDMVFLDVSGRVQAALYELAAQPDAVKHEEGKQIRVTRQEISRMVGCSREMAGRVLKELQHKGIVWAHGKTMVIYDEEHRLTK